MPKIAEDEHLPSASWSLRQLTDYTVKVWSVIQRTERLTAADTYRIGRALFFAQEKLTQELRWMKWLNEHNIAYATARQAIELYRAVKDESELEGITITDAKVKYRIRSDNGNSSGTISAGGGNGNKIADEATDEEKIDGAFHRVVAASNAICSIQTWKPDILYLPEVAGIVKQAQRMIDKITIAKQRIKPPRQVKVREQLNSL